jgi:hypothetical protein
MSSIFIRNAFGVVGDKTVVPMDATLSGTVSFEVGFGPRYELDQKIDPDALAVPRDETNYILYALSLNTQQYQTLSAPDFISTADNDGAPYSYAKGVKTRFEYSPGLFRFYESLKAANTDTPATPASWRWVDNDAGKLTIDAAVFETGGGAVVDGDAVYWNNAGPYFSKAQAIGTGVQEFVGIADVTNKRVLISGLVAGVLSGLTAGAVYYLDATTPGHITTTVPSGVTVRVGIALNATSILLQPMPEVGNSVPTGSSLVFRGFTAPSGYLLEDATAISRVTYANLLTVLTFVMAGTTTSGTDTVTGLSSTARMFPGMAVEGTGIPSGGLHIVSVDSGTQVTLSGNATASGTVSLTFFPYDNGDGSTTYNLPDSRRRVDVGAGGSSTSYLGNAVGCTGGEDAHIQLEGELAAHAHTYTKFLGYTIAGRADGGDFLPNFGDEATSTTGNSDPMNVIQKSLVATKIIKY